MAQSGQMDGHILPSRVPTIQKWLNRLLLTCTCVAFGLIIAWLLLPASPSLIFAWLIAGAIFGAGPICQGIIVYLFPEHTVASWRRDVERVGVPRLLGLAYIWLGIWVGGSCLLVGLVLATRHYTPLNDFILGSLVGVVPSTMLHFVAWVCRPARSDARSGM